jgi:Protein of unknown function (DUF1254)
LGQDVWLGFSPDAGCFRCWAEGAAAPINQFAKMLGYVSPYFKTVVRVSLNSLWTTGWLDLAKEPIVLSVPDTMLMVTFRPEFQQAWSGQFYVTILMLNRLGGPDGAALVAKLTGNATLSHEVVDEIVNKADGVPLFVEELTKAVMEGGDRDNSAGGFLAANQLLNQAIPANLIRCTGSGDARGAGPEAPWLG